MWKGTSNVKPCKYKNEVRMLETEICGFCEILAQNYALGAAVAGPAAPGA